MDIRSFPKIITIFFHLPESQIAKCHQIVAVCPVPHRIILVKNKEIRQGNRKIIDFHMVAKMLFTVIDKPVKSRLCPFCFP